MFQRVASAARCRVSDATEADKVLRLPVRVQRQRTKRWRMPPNTRMVILPYGVVIWPICRDQLGDFEFLLSTGHLNLGA